MPADRLYPISFTVFWPITLRHGFTLVRSKLFLNNRAMHWKSIKNTIALSAGLCLSVTIGVLVLHSSYAARQTAILSARDKLLNAARAEGNRLEAHVEEAMVAARTLAQALSSAKTGGTVLSRDTVNLMLKAVLERNPGFAGVYTAWEPDAFDGQDARHVNTPGHDATGRFIPYWNRNEEENIVVEPLLGYENTATNAHGGRIGDYYLLPRETKNECIIEPYLYPVQGKATLMTSLVVPIVVNGAFVGIAGIDLPLHSIQQLVDRQLFSYRGARVYIVSHLGQIAAAAGRPDWMGQPLRAVSPNDWEAHLELIRKGVEKVERDDDWLAVFTPLRVGESFTPWSVVTMVPAREIVEPAEAVMWREIVLGVLCLGVALALLWLIANNIAKPISRTIDVAQTIAEGDLAKAHTAVAALMRRRMRGCGGRSDAMPATAAARQDETGKLIVAMGAMIDKLSSLAGQVQRASVQLVGTAADIAQAAQVQETSVTDFGELTVEMMTASREISATSRQLAQTMEDVKATATDTGVLADKGRTGLRGIETSMRQLGTATTDISSKLTVIDEKAKAITSMVTTIVKVADQTNLLSLNASIEAEKAGENGVGFAVVAREIRRLADQTSAATVDIERTVKQMQSAVSAGVTEMDKFSKAMTLGVEVVGGISLQLGMILEQVKILAPRFETVNEGMRAQTAGADHISEAISKLSAGARATSESILKFNRASEQLTQAAQNLQAEAERFKV